MFGKPKNNSDEEDTSQAASQAMSGDAGQADAPGGGNGNGSSGGNGGGGFLLDRSKPSVISEGFSLQGDITAKGVLHVEGFIKGNINTEVVNVGPRGAVEGTITCKSLHVKGAFVGTAECDELFIASKARVVGRITYRSVAIQRGAMIEGDLIHAA